MVHDKDNAALLRAQRETAVRCGCCRTKLPVVLCGSVSLWQKLFPPNPQYPFFSVVSSSTIPR